MTLLVFTFVLMIGKILQIIELMVNKGVQFYDISKLIIFIMPSFLTFTMPISLLIAILIGMGRLSGDNEITVLRASGISLYRLIEPIIFMACIVCLFTAVIGYYAPLCNQATKDLLFQIVQQKASIGIKEKFFNDDFQDLVLYADRITTNEDSMEGILISDSRLANEPTTIIARRGYLISNPNTLKVTLRLMDGSIHSVDSSLTKYKKTDFSSYDVNLDLKKAAAGSDNKIKKGSRDMTIDELLGNIKRADMKADEVRDMVIELHKKISIPLSCLVFAILAVPFGIVSKRSGKSRGFTVGILIVVFYYTLQLAGEAMGETGKISPILAAWTPNAILGALGLYLFIMSAQEKPILSKISGRISPWIEKFKGNKK
jgi:lipopolysaccharide export system permease protein